MGENNRLNSEIKIQTNIADNYKALWEVYKKHGAGKVKDAKGDEVELTKRLVELEKELDKTTERYRSMFLKYSFAFSRKDEYKDCYFRLKLASERKRKIRKTETETWRKHSKMENKSRARRKQKTEIKLRLPKFRKRNRSCRMQSNRTDDRTNKY